jgi:cobalt-zinc-cadmium efflux system membrane fusion protein
MDSLDSATGPGTGRGPRAGWSQPRQISALVGAVAVVVLIALGYWLFEHAFRPRPPEATAPAAAAGTFRPSSQQLKTLTVEPVTLRAFVSEERTEGKIAVNADRATPVYSPYSGRVTRVIANLGDRVMQGAPLANIDASEFTQGLNDLRASTAQLKLARLAETRKHALYDIKGGSLADWQQAQADLSAAQTALNASRSRLQILGYSDAQIDQLANSDHFEPATAILAPIRGVVVDRQIGPGQYAQAGAYPERTFSARVVYVAPTIDPGTHRLMVRAVMDNADGALKPEMFATFVILTSDSQQSPAVPDGAVVYEGDVAHVWLMRSDGTLVVTPIRTGRTNDGFVEVLDGLKAGDRVVTKGSLFIDRAAAG